MLGLEAAAELQAAADSASKAEGVGQARGDGAHLISLSVFLGDFAVELGIALVEGGDLGLQLGEDAGASLSVGLGVLQEGEGGACGEGIYMRVDLLDVEENTRERGREVERRVGGVVGCEHKRIGEGRGREGRVEEGLVVDIGRFVIIVGSGGASWRYWCAHCVRISFAILRWRLQCSTQSSAVVAVPRPASLRPNCRDTTLERLAFRLVGSFWALQLGICSPPRVPQAASSSEPCCIFAQ